MTTPNTPHTPPPYYHDDEISLVDLAKILIKRWKIMVLTFIVIAGGALAYAMTLPRVYQYVTIYNAAEQSPNTPLESLNTLVAKANNLYLGPLTREMLAEQGWQMLPFDVSVENPDDTLLITLSSDATPDLVDQVRALHESVLQRLEQGQAGLVERRQEVIERQLASTERSLEALEDSTSPAAGELIATYTQRITNLETQLIDLQPGDVSQLAVQSVLPTGTSRSLIVALGLVIGSMLALMAAFMSHFISLVRASFQEE